MSGSAPLTAILLREQQIRKVTACDVSARVLEKAAQRLHTDRMPTVLREKLTLMQASLTYRDQRFEGYDCACVVEVIEYIEPMRIPAFERCGNSTTLNAPTRVATIGLNSTLPSTLCCVVISPTISVSTLI